MKGFRYVDIVKVAKSSPPSDASRIIRAHPARLSLKSAHATRLSSLGPY